MFLKYFATFILLFFCATPAWSGGNKSHEIKDLFDTIRGKVFGYIIEKKDSETIEISNQVSDSDCTRQQNEENSVIDNLSSEWKSTRPKNLEAELPKVCLTASAHISKSYCPTELRSQFEFNFFIDVTDCFNVPQKQVLMNLYNLPDSPVIKLDKTIWTTSDRSSCQRIQTLLQLLEEGDLKTHVTNVISKVTIYAQAQQELQKYVRTKQLLEEDSVQWALITMKVPQKISDYKTKNTRMPAQTKKSPRFKLDIESQKWIEKLKSDEDKLNNVIGNGVCTMSPAL